MTFSAADAALDPRNHAGLDAISLRDWLQWSGRILYGLNVGIGEFLPVVQRYMLGLGHDLKILPPVVGLVPIDVVDDLRPQKRAPEAFLGNEPMFRDIATAVCLRMVWSLQHDVSAISRAATLPARVMGFVVNIATRDGAKLLAPSGDLLVAGLADAVRLRGHGDLQSLCRGPGQLPLSPVLSLPKVYPQDMLGDGYWSTFVQRVNRLRASRK